MATKQTRIVAQFVQHVQLVKDVDTVRTASLICVPSEQHAWKVHAQTG